MLPALDVRHLARSYHAGVSGCCASVRVLADVTLRVRAGEIVGVCGGGGAGKTTLLLCAAGVLAPDRGEVRWFGAPADWRARRERGVAFATDGPPQHDFLTARQSLEYAAASDRTHGGAARLEVREAAFEVRALLDRVGLVRVARRRVAALSPGARVRLALARGLIQRPRLLLLDAPLDGLDERWRASVALVLRGAAAEGVACLVGAREYGALCGLADRIVTLVDGHAGDDAAEQRSDGTSRTAWGSRVVADRVARRASRVAEGSGRGAPLR